MAKKKVVKTSSAAQMHKERLELEAKLKAMKAEVAETDPLLALMTTWNGKNGTYLVQDFPREVGVKKIMVNMNALNFIKENIDQMIENALELGVN